MSKPVKKTTKTNTQKRRSHHALGKSQFVNCESCGSAAKPPQTCTSCGSYKGKKVTTVPETRLARRVRKLKPLT